MNLNLRVVQYLLESKKKVKVEQTLDNFFENGVNFPQFVALAFNIESIPNIIAAPTTSFQKNFNNNFALKYLYDNNVEISQISPNYSTQIDKENLLYLILIKQIYKIDLRDILAKINQLLQRFGVEFETKNDILNPKCILFLLNILTDGKVPINITDKIQDIDQLLIEIFKIAKAPLVIDKSCFRMPNQYLLLIQIEIIFDFFSEKVHQILNTKISDQIMSQFKLEFQQQQKEEEKQNLNQKKELGRTHKLIQFQFDKVGSYTDSTESSFYDLSLDDLKPNKEKNQHKKKKKIFYNEDHDILIEKMNDEVLLKTLNEIGKFAGIHFDDMQQSVENDNLPKFVMHLLKDDQIIQNENDQTNERKIEIVLNYLIEKEPAFDHLLFDFNDIDYVESSAILFYTNLLNFFFLKQSREKLYERVYTLLYGKYNKKDKKFVPYNNKREILTNWKTYIKLIGFIFLDQKITHVSKYANSFIKKKLVPFVLTHEYLKEYGSNDLEIPFGFYYQLQFIFNILDNGSLIYNLHHALKKFKNIHVPNSNELFLRIKVNLIPRILISASNKLKNIRVPNFITICNDIKEGKISFITKSKIKNYHRIIEILLITLRKFNNTKVPDYNQFIQSISAKNISLILQRKRQIKQIKKKKEKIENVNKTDNYLLKYENKLKVYSKEMPKMPKTFNERVNENDYKIHKQENKKIKSTKGIKFWNPIDNSYDFNGSIIFIKDDEDEDDSFQRFNELLSFKKDDFSMKKKMTKKLNRSIKDDERTKLYKLFYYDKELLSWDFNDESFADFQSYIKEINTNSNVKYPIVFVMNSLEEDTTTFASKLLKKKLPDIPDDNSIYIYGICDDNLFDLTLYSNKSKNKDIFKPIFLFLHMPNKSTSKQIPNIKKIIYQIYIFLSFISDINIVILNPSYTVNQIKLINNIYKIKNTYQFETVRRSDNQTDLNQTDIYDKSKKKQPINSLDDNYDYDDYDEFDDGFAIDDNDIDHVYRRKKYLKNIDNIISKEMKLILLINDSVVKFNKPKKSILNSPLFNNLDETLLKNLLPCYIDIEDVNTYGHFLDLFAECAITGMLTFSNIKYLFSSIPLFEMSNKYIDLKLSNKYTEILSDLIQGRFKQNMESNDDQEDDFTIVSNLQRELLHTYPILDKSYHDECKKIMAKLKEGYTHKHKTIFIDEIRKSSENSLNYLDQIIKSEPLFTIHDVRILQNSHINFLKEEFIRIIHYFYNSSLFTIIYEDNMEVLDNQIKEDTKKLNDKYKYFENSQIANKEIKVKPQQGTNYTVRERENEREITIRVDIGGDLEKLIEQDF